MKFFFNVFKIKSALSAHAQMVFKCFLSALMKRKIVISWLASKKISESCIKILFRLSFAFIGRLSQAYIHGQLSEAFSGSQAAFGTTFRDTNVFRKPEQTPWRWLQEGFLQLVSYFIDASRNYIWIFSTKRQPKIVKTISAHTKSSVLIFVTLKKIIHIPSTFYVSSVKFVTKSTVLLF